MPIFKNQTLTIKSAEGLCVEISPYGAAVTSIKMPNSSSNLLLELSSPKDVVSSGSYAGAMVGAVAGRIPDSVVSINKTEYKLRNNDGKHFLHGGYGGLSGKLWTVMGLRENSLLLVCRLYHLEDGLPGNRTFTVEYTVHDLTVAINILATSDRLTPVNITNHMYFNLSGNIESSALEQNLLINADKVLINDYSHIVEQSVEVSNTPFDFTKSISLAENISKYPNDPQLKKANGYNNAFILKNSDFACKLSYRKTKNSLKIITSYPSIVLYSGGFLSNTLKLADNKSAAPSRAIALEPQFPPCKKQFSSNDPDTASPTKPYINSILYSFSND